MEEKTYLEHPCLCDICLEARNKEIKRIIEEGIKRLEFEQEIRKETLESFCIMVKNELKQQKLDGFSLDEIDFNAVFEAAKKTILFFKKLQLKEIK